MPEVTTPLLVVVWLVGGAAFGGLVLGLLPALYMYLFGKAEPSLTAREAERRIEEINRAAQQAMMADALGRVSDRARVTYDPIDAEWQEDRG